MGETPEALLTKVSKGEYEMDPKVWDEVSPEAKDLVKGLLLVDPSQRITASQAL